MGLRDPLDAMGEARRGPIKSKLPVSPTTRFNRRATDTLGEDSDRYPAAVWPITSHAERDALLDQIGTDLAAGRIDYLAAYHERLRWAFRCMKEGI